MTVSSALRTIWALLDSLCACAQPGPSGSADATYRWGQLVLDATGDNVTQTGLHGTAQAVLALASAAPLMASPSRYDRFRFGGLKDIEASLTTPFKILDRRKTLKVAECTAALAAGGAAYRASAKSSLDSLIGGQLDKGRWAFSVDAPAPGSDHAFPTAYALDACSYCAAWDAGAAEAFRTGTPLLINELPHLTEAVAEPVLARLTEAIWRFTTTVDSGPATDAELLDSVATLVCNHTRPLTLSANERLEYRVDDGGSGTHAFAVVPTGVALALAHAWAAERMGSGTPEWAREVIAQLAASPGLLAHDRNAGVRTVSYAVRFLTLASAAVDQLVATPSTGNIAFPAVVPSQVSASIDAAAEVSVAEREQRYLTAHKGGDGTVRVLKALTGGYSGAYVDLAEVVFTSGATSNPRVFKLAPTKDVSQELKGAETAAELIPPLFRVALVNYAIDEVAGTGVLVYEYGGASLRRETVMPLLQFVTQYGDVGALEDVFLQLFGALAKSHTVIGTQRTTFNALLQHYESVRRGRFAAEILDGIHNLLDEGHARRVSGGDRVLLRYPQETIIDLTRYLRVDGLPSFREPLVGAVAQASHGDLNPRNVLMVNDGDWRPVVIDFHRFARSTPLFVDFARMEAGMMIKGRRADIQVSASQSAAQRNALAACDELCRWPLPERSRFLPPEAHLGADTQKAAALALTIRKLFAKASTWQPQGDWRAYWASLALCYLSYLRPVYASRLTLEQRLESLFLGSRILELHFFVGAAD